MLTLINALTVRKIRPVVYNSFNGHSFVLFACLCNALKSTKSFQMRQMYSKHLDVSSFSEPLLSYFLVV